jgi:hypothetical protein
VRRLELPTVTLCAATSVNIDATVAAMTSSMEEILFGDIVLFTDLAAEHLPDGGRVVPIGPIRSGHDYSRFLLHELADHIRTDHCLIVQWDGFVMNACQWDERFLACDYIGAPWPQFTDGHDVGNGGFSLRSRRLLEACRSPEFIPSHPEDVAVGRVNRDYLEASHGMVFADRDTAARFAFERSPPNGPTFGFHGIFNMIPLLGAERFWQVYCSLTDRSTVFHDYVLVMRQLGSSRNSARRRLQLTLDLICSWLRKPAGLRRRL